MSLQMVFNNFSHLAEAPNSVIKFRELILHLAVQGKLVAQQSKRDGESLLEALWSAGDKKFCDFDAFSFDKCWSIPNSWTFTTLESASFGSGLFADGDWIESKDQDPSGPIRLIQLADVGNGKYKNKSSRFLNEETAARLNCTFLETNDVLVARMPDPIGRACTFPGDIKRCVTAVDVCILRPNTEFFLSEFLVIAINSPPFRQLLQDKITGTTRSRISRGNLSKLPIPLLGIEEQKIIVAKVNELMLLCDALEAQEQAKRESRVRLNHAMLARLNEAASLEPQNFEQAIARLGHQFDRLYESVETVRKLRSTILQLAVQGKLVQQDQSDFVRRQIDHNLDFRLLSRYLR